MVGMASRPGVVQADQTRGCHEAATGESPVDSKNFAIGVLSTTAMILLVGLVVVQTAPPSVRADGMTVAGGDYVVTVGARTQTDEDYVYIIDVPAEKMIAYRFDTAKQQIEIVQGMDLSVLRQAPAKPEPGKPGQRRP